MPVKVYRLYKKPKMPPLKLVRIRGREDVVHAEEIVDIILEALKLKPKWFWRWLINNAKIYVADEWYNLVNLHDLLEINNKCQEVLEGKPWEEEVFDCDDFTNVMLGEVSLIRLKLGKNLAFGKIWFCCTREGWCHATSFYINEDKQFVWYEPQRCQIYPQFKYYCDRVILVVI